MNNIKQKKGILLIQLGTPDDSSTAACRRFLHEFLMDRRVIDIPLFFRWLLVYGIIGPFRSPKSASAYQSIWTSRGSPLRFFSEDLKKNLATSLGDSFHVELGMRYGSPSIEKALQAFEENNISQIQIIPLYPQYASASFGSSIEKVFEVLNKKENIPFISILPPFFDEAFFIESFAEIAKPFRVHESDHVLMSFHGLPERQIKRLEHTADFCYKAQSYRTAELLKEKLNISAEKMTVCFQSRLGRTPWIQPFTDEVIIDLAKAGKKNITVFCPSFTADCLETLEEIAVRGLELFRSNGGESLVLIPSLNSDPAWVKNLSQKILNS